MSPLSASQARAVAVAIALGASIGCVTASPGSGALAADTPEPGVVTAPPGAPPPPTPDGGIVLGRLSNPTLPSGACGMLIWMLDGDAPTPVFRYISGAAAQIAVGGRTVELARIETNGTSGFGVFEKQRFTSGAGLTLEITVEFGTPFDGGAWLQNGLVAIESGDGWRSVAPVAGVAGCRSK